MRNQRIELTLEREEGRENISFSPDSSTIRQETLSLLSFSFLSALLFPSLSFPSSLSLSISTAQRTVYVSTDQAGN